MSILVIGADGLIGAALMRALVAKGRIVHGTTKRRARNTGYHFLDLADGSIESCPIPDAETAIICAAVNGFARCRTDPELAYQVNVRATEVLTRRLVSRGSRVIYLSSSAVFDFRHPHVPGDHPYCPTTVYGKSKAAAEQCVLSIDSSNTVIRLTKVVASNTAHFGTWLFAFRSNFTVRAYSDLHFCPITLDYAASAIIDIADRGTGGIYQVSGADDISYSEAARYLGKRMGRDDDRVFADMAVMNGIPPEEVARFTSLDPSRFAALTGKVPPAPLDVLNCVFDPLIAELVVP